MTSPSLLKPNSTSLSSFLLTPMVSLQFVLRLWNNSKSSVGKVCTCNAGDLGSIPGLGRSPGEGKFYPLLYSGLYSPWGCKELDTTEQLSLSLHSLTGQSVKNLPAVQETQVWFLVRKIAWRRKWQPIPVFLPGKSHGQRSLASSRPWGRQSVGHSLATKTTTTNWDLEILSNSFG